MHERVREGRPRNKSGLSVLNTYCLDILDQASQALSGILKKMGSNGGDEVLISGNDEAICSEATVEIKIKTLDSQTYTLRVDKCVPVPALKEQIATVTGVLSEQQRLICRGKVLKDDQLLSAYHVEDGHTLHLVVGQPIPPSSETLSDHSATDPASSTGRNQVGPNVVVGTFNISEQGDGVFPDLSRIMSAVLGSFGITNSRSASEGVDLREYPLERLSRTPGFGGLRNSSGQQPDQAATGDQSGPHNYPSLLPTAAPLEHLQPPVIPDSLMTLSLYLSHLRHDFNARDRGQSSQSAGALGNIRQESDTVSYSATGPGGFPTPASLANVMLSTRQILIEQAGECLSQLTRQLEDHANVTDPLARMNIQSNAMRSGDLLQNLGALLLELGRTTMTLRMGQTPADAVVSAGPAVFISTSGPNPIMVQQPLPFQPATSFGAIPAGTLQPGSGLSGGSLASGFLPRNIDIRIHTGSLMPSAIVNQREPTAAQQSPGQGNPATSGGGNSIHQATAGASESPSSTRESEVRVVPIRMVVAAVPAPVRRSPSDSAHGSMGLVYPVLARVQHVTTGNLNSARGSQASDESHPGGLDSGRQPLPDPAVQQNIGVPGTNGSTSLGGGTQNGQGFSTQIHSGLDHLLRTIFHGEQIHVGDVNFQEMGMGSARGHGGTTQDAANTHDAAPRVVDEGALLSNLLRQIMPIISQSIDTGSNIASPGDAGDIEDRTTEVTSTQAQENSDRGTSSRRQGDPPSPPVSKRQKRE
ncbi:hypothetical protein F0562_012285 [Nyssa sinensis]|uniref:Ubiquitin-like domain-containing protein n=1 Tax=Nyssa sinensis TaxID=561372 RepID=A0A5J4ZW61_9ASTE|nr:hypothetical protein F0562_012285 [Nyssa sinensis]